MTTTKDMIDLLNLMIKTAEETSLEGEAVKSHETLVAIRDFIREHSDERFKLVPINPTEKMCREGESCEGASSSKKWIDGEYTPENVALIYKAMIEAAEVEDGV